MRVSRPVWRFAASGISAALGFIGLRAFVPLKGQDDIPMWHTVICFSCLALMVVGLIGLLVSLVWWVTAEVLARRKSKLVPPESSS